MSNRIEAPGDTALWAEAALRALTGAASPVIAEGTDVRATEDYIREVARDAMAIATAFEAACVAAHEAEQEAARERVRAIGRFRSLVSESLLTVESIEGHVVTFALCPGDKRKNVSTVDMVLDDECYEPAPLDASAPPTTGGEAASK